MWHEDKEAPVGILGWIVLGIIAGAIAKAIMPGKDPGGIIITMLLGIVGFADLAATLLALAAA